MDTLACFVSKVLYGAGGSEAKIQIVSIVQFNPQLAFIWGSVFAAVGKLKKVLLVFVWLFFVNSLFLQKKKVSKFKIYKIYSKYMLTLSGTPC